MLTLAPITSDPRAAVRTSRRTAVSLTAPISSLQLLAAPAAPRAPCIPFDCLAAAQAARPGDGILVTVDVVDASGELMYRVLDRFVREDDAIRWVPNVGAGPAPALLLHSTRCWEA